MIFHHVPFSFHNQQYEGIKKAQSSKARNLRELNNEALIDTEFNKKT